MTWGLLWYRTKVVFFVFVISLAALGAALVLGEFLRDVILALTKT